MTLLLFIPVHCSMTCKSQQSSSCHHHHQQYCQHAPSALSHMLNILSAILSQICWTSWVPNFPCFMSRVKLLPQPGKLPTTRLLSTSLVFIWSGCGWKAIISSVCSVSGLPPINISVGTYMQRVLKEGENNQVHKANRALGRMEFLQMFSKENREWKQSSPYLIFFNSCVIYQSNIVMDIEVEKWTTFTTCLCHNKIVESVMLQIKVKKLPMEWFTCLTIGKQ